MMSTDFSPSQRPWRILIWHIPSGRSKSSLVTGKKSTAGRRGKRGRRFRPCPFSLFPCFPRSLWNPRSALACNPQKSIRRTLSVMTLKNAFYFIFSLLLMAGIGLAQQAAPPAAPPPMPDAPVEAPEAFSLFIGGGRFLGGFAGEGKKEKKKRFGPRGGGGGGLN